MSLYRLQVDLRDVRLVEELLNDDPYYRQLSRPFSNVWEFEGEYDTCLDFQDAVECLLTDTGLGYEQNVWETA